MDRCCLVYGGISRREGLTAAQHMPSHISNLIGLGIYSVPEAARLTGINSRTIRRWLRGYSYKVGDELRHSPEVVFADLRQIEEAFALTFRDLIEVRFVQAFRHHGVSSKTLRAASSLGQRMLQTTHPFSTKAFRTDGKKIFAELANGSGDPKLLDLLADQYVFRKILAPHLYRDLERSADDEVLRWWPMNRTGLVVLDPGRSFGQPIINEEGVSTWVLAKAFEAEESINRVAEWFDVKPASVRAAVTFENQLAA